jgi:hypothetical protein
MRTRVDPRARRRRIVAVASVFAAVTAAVAFLVVTHRPDDEFTRQEIAFERHEDAAGLAPPDMPASIDVDAVIAGIGDAETRRAATAAHRPLPDEARASIHAFFDAYLARVLEISPDSAFRLGVHPHPLAPGEFGDATEIRWLLLSRDAERVLREWPGAERLSVHDRIDRLALLDEVETSLRWQETPDLNGLDHLDRFFDPLVQLAGVSCCPAADRIAVATARLRALPKHLHGVVEGLDAPPKSRVFVTAANLDAANDYLGDYVRSWRAAPDSAIADLEAAIGPARQALTDCARLLRTAIATRATGSLAIGPANTATILRFHHHLPFDARTVYEQALAALRAAHDEMRACRGRARHELSGDLRDPVEMQIRELRDACKAWIAPLPADEGIVVRPLPRLWEGQGAAAVYLDPGNLVVTGPGVVLVGEPPLGDGPLAREYRALDSRHTIAHETYPGHRLHAVAGRAACPLRRFLDDRVLVEGWAVYAEDLLHETGGCAGGGLDDWTRATMRASHAADTLIGILLATGTASASDVLELLREWGWTDPTLEDVGTLAAKGLYALGYSLGRDEIVALRRAEEDRRGGAFDLRAFHAKLLSAGPISPRLVEEEWRAEDR